MDDIQAVAGQLVCKVAIRPNPGSDKPILLKVTKPLPSGVRSTMEMDLDVSAIGMTQELAACVIVFFDLGDINDQNLLDAVADVITRATCELERLNPRQLYSLDSPRLLTSTEYQHIAQQWLYDQAMNSDGVSRLRFWKDRWWWWDGAYDCVSEHYIRHRVYSWLSGMQFYNQKNQLELYNPTKSKVANIVDPLRYLPKVFLADPVQMPEWIETPIKSAKAFEDLVCFEDCMMDCGSIFRGEPGRFEPTPRLFSAWRLPYKYDQRAECPWWIRTVQSCLPDDRTQKLLQEWMGLLLVPDVRHEKMLMMIGQPAAGKGTIISGMEAMLGARNLASTSFAKLGGQFGLAGLVGKLAAIDGDAQITQRTDSSAALEMVKRITSGDLVPVEPKGVDAETTRLVCRFTVACNEFPMLPDQSSALRRRLLLIYFPNTFVENPDRGLKDRIMAEGPGICNWALAGLRRLREKGYFTIPQVSARLIDNYVASMSPVASFISQRCNISENLWVNKTELFEAWDEFRQSEHLPKINRSTFGARVINYAPSVTAVRAKYNGIDLKHEFRRM